MHTEKKRTGALLDEIDQMQLYNTINNYDSPAVPYDTEIADQDILNNPFIEPTIGEEQNENEDEMNEEPLE